MPPVKPSDASKKKDEKIQEITALMRGWIGVFFHLPTRSSQNAIFATMQQYRRCYHLYDERPHSAEQTNVLKEVQKKAAQLRQALAQLDDASREAFLSSPPSIFQTDLSTRQQRIEGLLTLGRLLPALDLELEMMCLPTQLGRVGRVAIYNCIRSLKVVYETETGKKATANWSGAKGAYAGPFLRFVEACFKPIDGTVCTGGLGETIRRALQKRSHSGQKRNKNPRVLP